MSAQIVPLSAARDRRATTDDLWDRYMHATAGVARGMTEGCVWIEDMRACVAAYDAWRAAFEAESA